MIARLYQAQRGLCFHCDKPMGMGSAVKRSNGKYNDGWTREHVLPRAHGGKRKNNIVLAHFKCNGKRGSNQLPKPMLDKAAAIVAAAKEISVKDAKQAMTKRYDLNQPWIHIYSFHPFPGEPKFIPGKKHD